MIGENGVRGTTVKNVVSNVLKTKQNKSSKPNKNGSNILCVFNVSKCITSRANMALDLAKVLKFPWGSGAWKGFSL